MLRNRVLQSEINAYGSAVRFWGRICKDIYIIPVKLG